MGYTGRYTGEGTERSGGIKKNLEETQEDWGLKIRNHRENVEWDIQKTCRKIYGTYREIYERY
jgi:hypothetical protein